MLNMIKKYRRRHHLKLNISTDVVELGIWLLLLSPLTRGLKYVLQFASVSLDTAVALALVVDTIIIVYGLHIRIS